MAVAPEDRITIDIDTGGTFTDGVVSFNGASLPVKVLTTPHDLTIALRELVDAASDKLGIDQADLLRRVESIRYSTTLGTNTVIERTGPHLGLLVTSTALDEVRKIPVGSLIGDIIDPFETHVRGVTMTGNEDADAEPMLSAVEQLLDAGAERLVIVLPDADGSAEAQAKRIVFREYPRHILGALPVLFSNEVAPDPKLVRRVSTALLNAYLHPQLEHFLYEAENVLRDRGLTRPLFVFGNDGTTNRVAKVIALKTHNSGPAGGVEAAAALARHYDLDRVATIDIGGTSTDVAFLEGAAIEQERRGRIEDAEVSLPMRRIDALGGGGGTIAEVRDGEFRLGPRSAGAAPGPACFGFGGVEATTTDANLVLGFFDPSQPFAGRITLDSDRARHAINERVAEPLGLSVEQAAHQVSGALEQRIGESLRRGIEARGGTPCDWTLLAYGGGGAVHGARIADHAGIHRVLVPGLSSVCSAFGIAFADVEHRYERLVPAEQDALTEVAELELTERARIDMRGEGFSVEDVEIVCERNPVEGAIEVTLAARAPLPHITLEARERPSEPPEPTGSRLVWWFASGATDTPLYDATAVEERHARIHGPAIVAGEITTICVPPGWVLERDRYDQLFLTGEA
jgi:N-methylhydantoinase A/oxoprolinase/acetone carboxylase beta subunit